MTQSLPTILLVEESRFFLTIEKQFLRNVPAEILEATTAADALSLCRDRTPHLIYMSHELTGECGASCCRTLKADEKLRNIPVVLIYDNDRPDHETVCRNAGCDALLAKPLDRHRFLEIGRSFLAGIRERRRSCRIEIHATAEARRVEGHGLDISSGGIFLETAETLHVGTVLQLELHLTRTREHGPRIRCVGVVAWINTLENPMKPNHPVGYGIKFTEVPVQSLGILNGFLKTLAS